MLRLIGGIVLTVVVAGLAWWLIVGNHPSGPGAASVLTPALERQLAAKSGADFTECAGCPTLVVVPAGTFLMGSAAGEGTPDEQPQHKVTITSAFAAGKYEVTFEEWERCVAAGACSGVADSDWGRGKRPVIYVSWDDAKHYVAWLARVTGKPYRLLSEAEWEYAARAGSTTLYPFGDDPLELVKHGWFATNANSRTQPVGQLMPNAFGLFDTLGNVWEWVEDTWHPNYQGAPADGSAWLGGDDGHVVRGGSWNYGPDSLRSATRNGFGPLSHEYLIGIRVARTLSH